jgi:hypothetical protein
MTLSEDKTLVTHLDTGFDSLGFHIQRKCRGDGRGVVLTYPSKQALAAVMRKIKGATGRRTTALRLADVLWKINPIRRGWAAYFRYGVSKRTFSYLGYYAWWRMMRWLRRKHPQLTWKQARRRYYGADRISEDGVTLYNPAKMKVERYLFREHRSARPSTSTRSRRKPVSVTPVMTTSPSSGKSPNWSPDHRSRTQHRRLSEDGNARRGPAGRAGRPGPWSALRRCDGGDVQQLLLDRQLGEAGTTRRHPARTSPDPGDRPRPLVAVTGQQPALGHPWLFAHRAPSL